MKKTLMLLALTGVVALSACGAQQPISRADLAAVSQQVADLAPIIVKAAEPAPLAPPLFPVQPPMTFGAPVWVEVTAIPAVRSPGSGANCTGVASEGHWHRLYIRSANCGAAGRAGLTFTLNGQTTTEVLGDQDLILVQLAAGNVVPVTAVVKANGETIWPK